MDDKPPEEKEKEEVKQGPSGVKGQGEEAREELSEAEERKTPMWAVAAIVIVAAAILSLSYQYYYLPSPMEMTTTSSSSTSTAATTSLSSSTSSSSSTTSSSTTLLVVNLTSSVRISGYQTESPYKPDKRYLHEEWVELKNTGDVTVNLGGWRIRNMNYKKTMELPEFYLSPGAKVRVHTGSGWPDDQNIYMGLKDEFWDNDLDVIAVFDSNLTLVEKLRAIGRLEYRID